MSDPPSDLLRASRPRHPPHRPLTDLAAWLAAADPTTRTRGDLSTTATGVTLASTRVLPGDVYAALPGSRAHGIDYAAAALTAGAVALLTDAEGAARAPAGIPVLQVANPRTLLGRFAAHLYGDPAGALRLLGVTGTQGKTTTTRLAEDALQRSGVRAAVVGTVGTRVDGEDIKTALTTPEAPDLHGLFAMMRERGVEACAMEVSSHALVQGRVDGVVFDVAVFTNLGRDHLDFHADEEDYFQAKAALFTPARCRQGAGERRRRARSAVARARGRPARVVLRLRRGGRLAGRGRGPRAGLGTVHRRGSRRPAGAGRLPAARWLQRLQRAGRAGRLRAGGLRRRGARRRHGRGSGCARPAGARRRRPGLHRRGRLRAQARRGGRGHRRAASAHRGPGDRGPRARAASATPASGR